MPSVDQALRERRAQPSEQATIRGRLQGMWASVAPAWQEHADLVDRRSRLVTERLIELAALRPGDRVLELACGPGGLGLEAALRVAPGGEVVLSDIAESMTYVAIRRAEQRGLTNVTPRVLDLEEIDEPDAAYDAVLCRDGLMFALNPGKAAQEIHRVLRPGGRYAVAVWGPRERNPWLAIVLDALGQQLGHPVPPPGVPGPFALQDTAELSRVLSDAHLEIAVEELSVPMPVASFEEWWQRTCALAGPAAKLIASLPPEVLEAVRERARKATESYDHSGGLRFPGLQLLAAGHRT